MRSMGKPDFAGFTLSEGQHNGSKVIWISFEYDQEKINLIKSLKGRWNPPNKSWYVPDNRNFRSIFGLEITLSGKEVAMNLNPENAKALQYMKELLQMKAYSPATIKTYTSEFSQLLYFLKGKAIGLMTYEELRAYILYCINTLKISENQMHSRLNAIKFYFEQVLNKMDFVAKIPRPKKPSTLPKVLSQSEIQRIFDVVQNPKHLLMLKLCYGMGLRVSEVVNLKLSDIDSSRMQVLIDSAKGKKDRYVPLPVSVLDLLRSYYKEFKPAVFLFEGQYGGQYSIRSVQAVFKLAMKKARVNKPVGIHGLRHSYATHLLEYGTDMAFIQKLLGHQDIKTTMIYAKVENSHTKSIRSPLDRWFED